MLSAICATYGLKQSKVLELNPGLKPNKLFVGKKIKLPGKIDLKDADAKSLAKQPVDKKQAKSVKASSVKASSAKASSYKGATKEYVVKSGDSLGKIAYSNGITIKCLKELNGFKKNTIRIGQKLKVPAEKPVVAAKTAPVSAKPASAPVAAQQPAPAAPVAESKLAETAPEVPAVAPAPAAGPAAVEAAPAAPEAAPAVAEPVKEEAPTADTASALTHTVKEGEDTVSIAIMYGVSPSAVMDLNDLKNTDSLKVGQVLKLPANAKVQ